MEQEYCTFTSANILLLVNDRPLGGVNKVVVRDFKNPTGPCTRISLDRVVFDGTQDVVEFMRTQRFSFKLMNNTTKSGWVSLDAELESYEMKLATEDSDFILHQDLMIKTQSFVYLENVSAEHIAAKEAEDFLNLVEILKKNQAKAGPPAAVLPDEYKEEKKDKKKKKKNKHKRA